MKSIIAIINERLCELFTGMLQQRVEIVGATKVVFLDGQAATVTERIEQRVTVNTSDFDIQLFHVSLGGAPAEVRQMGRIFEYRWNFRFRLVGVSNSPDTLRLVRQRMETTPNIQLTGFVNNTREIAKTFWFLQNIQPELYCFVIDYTHTSADPEVDCACLTERECVETLPKELNNANTTNPKQRA